LFGFEACGVLFVDGVEGDPEAPNLYKINHLPTDAEGKANLTEYDYSRGFMSTVQFPRTLGITGHAIAKRKVQVAQVGENAAALCSELDNSVGCSVLESMLIAPIYDHDGILRGAVQLINKQDGYKNVITPDDIREVEAMLPTFAGCFRTADKVRVISNNMTNAWYSMNEITEGIHKKLDMVEPKHFVEINTALCSTAREVGAMLDKHKDTILKDEWLVHEILSVLRIEKRQKLIEQAADARRQARKNKSADDGDVPEVKVKIPKVVEIPENTDEAH
jgi:hypothetical protein